MLCFYTSLFLCVCLLEVAEGTGTLYLCIRSLFFLFVASLSLYLCACLFLYVDALSLLSLFVSFVISSFFSMIFTSHHSKLFILKVPFLNDNYYPSEQRVLSRQPWILLCIASFYPYRLQFHFCNLRLLYHIISWGKWMAWNCFSFIVFDSGSSYGLN